MTQHEEMEELFRDSVQGIQECLRYLEGCDLPEGAFSYAWDVERLKALAASVDQAFIALPEVYGPPCPYEIAARNREEHAAIYREELDAMLQYLGMTTDEVIGEYVIKANPKSVEN